MSRRLAIALALCAVPALGLAGCNAFLAAHDTRHAETTRTLREQAHALVPDDARIVFEEESACLMFRSPPSCVILLVDWPGTYERRLDAVDELFRANGWRHASGGHSSLFRRDDVEASIHVHRRGEAWKQLCPGRDPAMFDRYERDWCLDRILVRVA